MVRFHYIVFGIFKFYDIFDEAIDGIRFIELRLKQKWPISN